MWFQVEDGALKDERVMLLAQELGLTYGEAFYRLCRVWAWLYKQGGQLMAPEEVDIVSEQCGLAEGMIKHRLADATPEGLRIRGDARAKRYREFCTRQKSRSGVAAEKRKEVAANTNAHPEGEPRVTQSRVYISPDLSFSRSLSPECEELAVYLRDAIRSHTPGARDGSKGWAKDVDLALRIDGLTPEQLRSAIDYAHRSQAGAFWRSNLLSGKALRKHAERLLIAARYVPKGGAVGFTGTEKLLSPTELYERALREREQERIEEEAANEAK